MSARIKFGPVHAHAQLQINVTIPRRYTGMSTANLDREAAREYAALLLSNDEARKQVTITYTEYCVPCGASGHVRKGRVATKPCSACQGRGELHNEVLETVER